MAVAFLDHPDRAVPHSIFAREGAAQVSYLPGHDIAEVEVAIHGRHLDCTAPEAWDLIAALMQVLGAKPQTTTSR